MKDPIINIITEAVHQLRAKREEFRAVAWDCQMRHERRHGRNGFIPLRTLNGLRMCAKLTAAITTLTSI